MHKWRHKFWWSLFRRPKLVVIHKWRHWGIKIFVTTVENHITQKCNDGREGCQKLRDVLFGWPLLIKFYWNWVLEFYFYPKVCIDDNNFVYMTRLRGLLVEIKIIIFQKYKNNLDRVYSCCMEEVVTHIIYEFIFEI